MNRIKSLGPIAVALVALVLVFIQQGRVSDLEAQIAAAPTAPAADGADTGPSAAGRKALVKIRKRLKRMATQSWALRSLTSWRRCGPTSMG